MTPKIFYVDDKGRPHPTEQKCIVAEAVHWIEKAIGDFFEINTSMCGSSVARELISAAQTLFEHEPLRRAMFEAMEYVQENLTDDK